MFYIVVETGPILTLPSSEGLPVSIIEICCSVILSLMENRDR